MAGRVYHWKHGWIPLDHVAAKKKYGAAGAAKHGFAPASASVSHDSLPRKSHIVATHDANKQTFSLHDTYSGGRTTLTTAQVDELQTKGAPITGVQANGSLQTGFPKFPEMTPQEVGAKYQEMLNQSDNRVAIRNNRSVEAYLGAEYVSINGGLRGQRPLNPATSMHISNIDRAFERDGLTLQEDQMVRRGSGLPPGVTYQAGAFAVEPGYTSTTIDPMTAQDFSNNEWGTALSKDIWQFDIRVPKGTRVLPAENPLQSEVILARNTKYRVVSVDHSTKQIQMDVVPNVK